MRPGAYRARAARRYCGGVAYTLYFWRGAAAPGSSEASIYAALLDGEWRYAVEATELLDFRRDLISSDPQWTSAVLLPRPDSGVPQDRYLAIVLPETPTPERLRDLRYVAARNRLTMFDPQIAAPSGAVTGDPLGWDPA